MSVGIMFCLNFYGNIDTKMIYKARYSYFYFVQLKKTIHDAIIDANTHASDPRSFARSGA